MRKRKFGRLNWDVSEIGHGMWGMGGQWKGSTDAEAVAALRKSFELGCNFYDTAWVYGKGHSENLFKEVFVEEQKAGNVYVATKVPPKNFEWPGKAEYDVNDTFPKEHILEYTKKSLENLGVNKIDLLLLHVWDDSWAKDNGWKLAVEELKRNNLIEGFGISINKWDSNNVIEAIKTDLIDAVQVVYNIFEQAPEDKLFPICKEKNIAVIARVPFDEGMLTGEITRATKFSSDDWRSRYFTEKMLEDGLTRLEALENLIPLGMSIAEVALRFVLQNPSVSTVIPGMRKVKNVEKNISWSDGNKLEDAMYSELKRFRWDRVEDDFPG